RTIVVRMSCARESSAGRTGVFGSAVSVTAASPGCRVGIGHLCPPRFGQSNRPNPPLRWEFASESDGIRGARIGERRPCRHAATGRTMLAVASFRMRPERHNEMHEREITTPVSLTARSGRLNPAAVGWSRRPLHDTDGIGRLGRGWGRNKRWEYWAVVTPTHIVSVTVSSLDYAAVHDLWVF